VSFDVACDIGAENNAAVCCDVTFELAADFNVTFGCEAAFKDCAFCQNCSPV